MAHLTQWCQSFLLLSEGRYAYTSESKLAGMKSVVMVRIMESTTAAAHSGSAVQIRFEIKAVEYGRCVIH